VLHRSNEANERELGTIERFKYCYKVCCRTTTNKYQSIKSIELSKQTDSFQLGQLTSELKQLNGQRTSQKHGNKKSKQIKISIKPTKKTKAKTQASIDTPQTQLESNKQK
jgi:hypothetical protein